jgi:Raf kinase inhibitor-like YbhB/YbcL family protein
MYLVLSFLNNKTNQITSFILILSLIISFQNLSQTKSHGKKMEIKLSSTAFKEGDFIPSKYSCEGANISPQLHWSDAPKNAKSYAIIVDDPDAPGGDFVHWVIYNIPGNLSELHEDITPSRNIPDEVMLGTNSFGRISYGGPCPPSGKAHRYFFKLYALDTVLHHLESGATKQQLLSAMDGHIIAEGHLIGKYKRSK